MCLKCAQCQQSTASPSLGEDKQVTAEDGEKPEGNMLRFTRIITDLERKYVTPELFNFFGVKGLKLTLF